jgi:hypothetical protein
VPRSRRAGRLHRVACALVRRSMRTRGGAIPPATTTLRRFLAAVGLTAALAASACGSSTAPAVSSNPSGSNHTVAPSAAGQADTGGVADTPDNPDRTYVCAAVATNSSGQTVGYLTVAGSDNAAAQSECSAVAQTSGWAAAATSPFHEKL